MDRPSRLAEPLADRPGDDASRNRGTSLLGVGAAELAALALIVAAHVWLLTRLLHSYTFFDEGVYLASLDELRHGAALGSEVFTSQVPGFYLVLQAIGAVTGVSVSGIRAGVVAIDTLGIVFAYLLARRLAGPAGGLLAAGIIAVAPELPQLGGRIFADQIAMAFVLASLWFAVTGRTWLAGAVFAGALSVKLSALTAAPTLVVLLIRARPWRRALPEAAVGAAIVVALLAIVYARDLRGIWDGAFAYHTHAESIDGLDNGHTFFRFWYTNLYTPFVWLTGAGLIATAACWRRVWPLWLWPALASAFVLEHKPLRDNHLIVLPYAFAIPTAVALALGVPVLARRTSSLRRRPVLAVAGAVAAVVLAAGWVQQLHRQDVDRVPEDPGLVRAAADVRRLTRPDELVISDQPIVPFLAGRRMPPDLVDTSSLRFDTGSLTIPGLLRTIAGDERITLVVAGRAFSARPELLAGLGRLFDEKLAGPGGMIFYGRRG